MTTVFRTASRRALPSDQDASGRNLGAEELANIVEAIHSGILTSTKGTFVREFELRFAAMLGAKHAFACSSGTAAIHCAIAALDPSPGDEIVTSPVTDMGALAPILYQGAIPVFADVDRSTCNVTAATIAECMSSRTRAIIATHLFGNPCEIAEIVALADRAGVAVIEDCAQSFLASYGGRLVGTIGKIGCFSLQQGKHVTTGEGGLVVTNDDDLARRIYLFINKGWGYGDERPDHYFLALNYRMSELCGSVGLAQLDKLADAVARRRSLAGELTKRLHGVDALLEPKVLPGAEHSYWKYCVRTAATVPAHAVFALARSLKERGIVTAPRYIQKPAFMCEVFQRRRTFGGSGFPLNLARPEAVDYRPERFPGTIAALERILVIPWNDRYDGDDVGYIADALVEAAAALNRNEVLP